MTTSPLDKFADLLDTMDDEAIAVAAGVEAKDVAAYRAKRTSKVRPAKPEVKPEAEPAEGMDVKAPAQAELPRCVRMRTNITIEIPAAGGKPRKVVLRFRDIVTEATHPGVIAHLHEPAHLPADPARRVFEVWPKE